MSALPLSLPIRWSDPTRRSAPRVAESLMTLLEREAPLAPWRVARIGAQIACALAADHRAGLVHRPLVTGNVMVLDGDRVSVLDFRSLAASPAFFSPEQIRHAPLTGEGDLYRLGVLLYLMATGSLPFNLRSDMAVMYSHVFEPARSPIQRNADMPLELSDLIMHMLEKVPKDRPRSAEKVQFALDRFADLWDPTNACTAPTPPPARVVMPPKPGARTYGISDSAAFAAGAALGAGLAMWLVAALSI